MKTQTRANAFLLALSFLFSIWGAQVFAAPTFPQLTGRVVDEANILSPQTEAQLTQLSAEIEKAASDQLVVVTLNSLQGYEIEEYGYQLGRTWKIGQTDVDNGILLIVAPNERKVRIEVGYGLEGNMPDMLANRIIREKIIPAFKAGDMEGGIIAGAQAIDETLKLSPEDRAKRLQESGIEQKNNAQSEVPAALIIFLIIFIFIMIQSARQSRMRRRGHGSAADWIVPVILHDWNDDDDHKGGWGGGGFGGGGFGGGGFGGGGGSFGGGGSSGGW